MQYKINTIQKHIDDVKNQPEKLHEIIDIYNEKIANTTSNAFITKTPEIAKKQAENVVKNIKNGKSVLFGLPLAVKDAFCTQGIRTTMASKMLENFVPNYESTVTERLFLNDAIILGKTNMDEFAMGSSGKHSYFGASISPIKINGENVDLIPGGSSSGSAVAVAEGLAVASLGTDTGGSVRQPAAFCGIVGFKPSYGRCSRYGIVAYASSLDQAGFLTNSVADSALLFSLTTGVDGKDSTLFNMPKFDFTKTNTEIKGKTIGIPKEFLLDGIEPAIQKAWQEAKMLYEQAGANVVEISLQNAVHSIKVYYFISTAEASSNLARFDGIKYGHRTQKEVKNIEELVSYSRAEGFGSEVKRRILIGTNNLLSDSYKENYERILKLRRIIKNEFTEAFKICDAILCPTTPNLAPRVNETQTQLQEYINDILTVPVNIAGLPAISVPFGSASCGRPIGMQLICNSMEERKLFEIASFLENV